MQCGKQSCFCNYKFIETTFRPERCLTLNIINVCFRFFFYFPLGHMQIIRIYPSPHSIYFVVNQMQILRFLCLSPTAICSCCCCPIRSCCCFCCCCCVLWLIRIDQLFHQCHQYALLLIEFAACKNSWIFKWPTWGNSFLSLSLGLSLWFFGQGCLGKFGKRDAREIYQELA